MRLKKVLVIALSLVLVIGISGCSCSKSDDKTDVAKDTKAEYNALDYVTLGQYEGLTVEINKADYELTDARIKDKMLELCGGASYEIDPDKTVVGNDSIVNVDYLGKKDGVAFDGGAAKDVWIDVKNNSDAEAGTKYIDGFANGVSGGRVGSTSEYEITFPANYGQKDLAGQTVIFEFTINGIAKDVTADLTDSYVKENSSYESVAALREAATNALSDELTEDKQTEIKNKISQAVIANCTVNSLPEGVVDKRVEEYIAFYKQRYADSSRSLDEAVKTNYGVSLDEFKEQIRQEIELSLRQEIVFDAIALEKNLTTTDEEFTSYSKDRAADTGMDDIDTYYRYAAGMNDVSYAKSYLKQVYTASKALDYCAGTAVVNEV